MRRLPSLLHHCRRSYEASKLPAQEVHGVPGQRSQCPQVHKNHASTIKWQVSHAFNAAPPSDRAKKLGRPCDRHGTYLPPGAAPPPFAQLNGQPPGSFAPFESRTDFDFAHFHFVELQSSAAEINTALDLWAAQVLQYGGAPPWRTAQDLYDAIDSIQHGDGSIKYNTQAHDLRYLRSGCLRHTNSVQEILALFSTSSWRTPTSKTKLITHRTANTTPTANEFGRI